MRILFLTPRFPYPPVKGDTLRAYHQIRLLSREHRITLLSLSEAEVGPEARAHMERICERVEVVPLPRWRVGLNLALGTFSREPLQVRYFASPRYKVALRELLAGETFDLVHVALIRMLPYVWGLREVPVVVDLIDSLALNLSARAEGAAMPWRPLYRLEWGRVRRYERAAAARFPALFVSSETDRAAIGGRGRVRVVPNGVDTERFAFRPQEGRDPKTLVFTGNMGYAPNEEAVLLFAREVWPLLRRDYPQLRFHIVGTNPSAPVRALGAAGEGIEVLGEVPDVAEHLGRATIAVCPMRSGSGIQNKVLEAMSTGTPVVATPIANRGVGAEDGRELLVAEEADQFAEAITRLLGDEGLRAGLANGGRALVERRFRWEEHARALAETYSAVLERGGRAEAGLAEVRGEASLESL
jgi:polysaccharide biosynthesis protein PslH